MWEVEGLTKVDWVGLLKKRGVYFWKVGWFVKLGQGSVDQVV